MKKILRDNYIKNVIMNVKGIQFLNHLALNNSRCLEKSINKSIIEQSRNCFSFCSIVIYCYVQLYHSQIVRWERIADVIPVNQSGYCEVDVILKNIFINIIPEPGNFRICIHPVITDKLIYYSSSILTGTRLLEL